MNGGRGWASKAPAGRWYRKLPWRPAKIGDIALCMEGCGDNNNGRVRQVVAVDEFVHWRTEDGTRHAGGCFNQTSSFVLLEPADYTCRDKNCAKCSGYGYVWGPEFPKPALRAGTDSTTKGGNTNTVRYTANNAWRPAFRGSIVFPTGTGPCKQKVCVVTDVIGETVWFVSFEDPSLKGTCSNQSGSHYSLELGEGRIEYYGPDEAGINAILGGCYTPAALTPNTYRIAPWRKARVGDVVLDKSYKKVCVVTRHRTLAEHGYGEHTGHHATTGSEVVTIAQYDRLNNTHERWNWEDSFEILVPDHNGSYIGPDHNTINTTGGTLNMDAQPLIIKTPKVIESIQAKLDEKKQVWDDGENARVEQAQNAGKVAAAFAKAHPGLVQYALEYRYGLLFSSHTDVESVDTWLKAAGYGSEIEQQDKKTVVEPAQEFPGDPTLEKMIRTLAMADNETVEVFPTDAVYGLL